MGHYTKKGLTIQALKWTGENAQAIKDFVGANADFGQNSVLSIKTLEGVMSASIGDMIIRGIKGEFYPCKSDIFHASYNDLDGPFSFAQALELLKTGGRVCRAGWNGKGMFVFLVNGSKFTVNREPLLSILGEGTEVTYNPHIDIKQVDGSVSTWVPSIGDVMAEDWQLVTK